MEPTEKDVSYAVRGYMDEDLPSLADLPFDPYALKIEPQNDLAELRAAERREAESEHARISRDSDLRTCARNATFSRLADWMHYLDVPHRDREVLAKIYGFQTSTNKGKAELKFHMSLANFANLLQIDRSNLQKSLKTLVLAGILIKESNGDGKPLTYRLDERKCMLIAISNGYVQTGLPITQTQAVEILEAEGYVQRRKPKKSGDKK